MKTSHSNTYSEKQPNVELQDLLNKKSIQIIILKSIQYPPVSPSLSTVKSCS